MAELQQQVQDVWDSVPQDDIRHLYDHMRKYMPALPPERATLCIDVIIWAPLTVIYVFHLI